MSDLIERLRYIAGPWSDPKLPQDAADEIERLTKERDAFHKAYIELTNPNKPMLFDTTFPDTIERLQRENEELRKAVEHAYINSLGMSSRLSAAEYFNEEHVRQINLRNDTIDGLRAELAALKASTEPVAWLPMKNGKVVWSEVQGGCITTDTDIHMRPVYTTPPTATALVEDFRKRAVEVCKERLAGSDDWLVSAIESLPLIGKK